jgi:uncharacterized protein (DUF1800 family)
MDVTRDDHAERGTPEAVAVLPQDAAAAGLSIKGGSLVPPFEVRVLTRMGFGPARRSVKRASAAPEGSIFRAGFEREGELGEDDLGYFRSLGRTDDERLQRYVDEQLDPALPDPDLQQRLAAHPGSFATLSQPLSQTYVERRCAGFSNYVRPHREVERAAFTRAVYSRRQLFELSVDFWHNHLNVFAGLADDTYVSWASWDRDVIRANAFGNFYDMLYASARHPAMLRYLDNYVNRAGGINENYARELVELHTLGAEHYLGVSDPTLVQALPENPYSALNDPDFTDPFLGNIGDPSRSFAAFYVDDDVYSAAECLTGWRINSGSGGVCGDGAFTVNAAQHSGSIRKAFLSLGVTIIPSDLPAEEEGRLIIKLAAYHPATAKYIARKLCRRFIADQPPEAVVDAAAATFYANRKAPNQIAQTLRTILLSPEFKDAGLWGSKIKRPFEYVVSAMRVAGCVHTFREDDSSSGDFLNVFNGAGQRLFFWRPPNGYPDQRDHWQGSTGLVQAWRSVDWLIDRNASDEATRVMRVIDLTEANVPGDPTPRQLVEFWCEWTHGFAPDGGWTGPEGTPVASAPTPLGAAALQFMTQQGYGAGNNDRNPWPADEPILRANLRLNSGGFDWYNRLRGMVALVLASPIFMQR